MRLDILISRPVNYVFYTNYMNVIAKKSIMLIFIKIYCNNQYKYVSWWEFDQIKPKYVVNTFIYYDI